MLNNQYRIAILTSSDKCSRGEREDKSAEVIREIATTHGYKIVSYKVLPDEQILLEEELKKLCDEEKVDLVLTTGGTGFSQRDCMPEATLNVSQKLAYGIPEALRQHSISITKKAMLSRSVAGIREKTLIINLPGSPKAVREHLEYLMDDVLIHALDIITDKANECAHNEFV